MSPPPKNTEPAELSIIGAETADHTVPADVLVRALNHLQQIVYLVAAAEDQKPLGERFGMTERFKERNSLRCGVPKESSFAVPLALPQSTFLVSAEDRDNPLVRALDLLGAAADGLWDKVSLLISSPGYLQRVLVELQAMLPRPGDRWGIALRVGVKQVALDAGTYRRVLEHVAPSGGEDAITTITGDLVRVDFDKNRIVVRYGPTGTDIPCYCERSLLDALVQVRYTPIQVTGRFTLDSAGNPKKLSRVSRIEPIDLTPMVFERIDWGGRQLVAEPPLSFEPTMDEESGQLYVLEDENLDIYVFAQTRDQVVDELNEQILFEWDAYAREDPKSLTLRARSLRELLLARFKEVAVESAAKSY